MNIVFIVSDQFRQDHLGCYGNPIIKTPHLDRFSRQCVVFDRFYSCSNPTMPARADIFTGKWTFTYLGWAPMPREETILAQLLTEAGYTTVGIVDTPFFVRYRARHWIATEAMCYDRGFQDFIQIRGQGTERKEMDALRRYESDYCAPMTMATAEKWLERHRKENFFLYVDTWDPHGPCDPPAWYVEQYYPQYDGRPVWGIGLPFVRARRESEERLKIVHACYCGEISMVDRWVGRLIDRIETLNLMDETAIIFTSDHGFYFGEHEIYGGKGPPFYEEATRVPLLVYVPGLKPRRTAALGCLPDLMPTVLELTGIKIPSTVEARSLLPILKGQDERGQDFIVTSWGLIYEPGTKNWTGKLVNKPWSSTITTREWSLLYCMKGYPVELYHLPSDPKQQKNVADKNSDVVSDLHHKFVSLLEKAETNPKYLEPRRNL